MEKFKQSFTIHSYETNQFGQASIVSVFNYLLEIAWAHAQVLEWGYEHLKGSNLFWVLSRMFIKIEQLPKWKDKIIIETWSKGTDGIYAYREFVILSESGKILLRASSAWLILDSYTRRIFRLAKYIDTFPRLDEENACRNPLKLRASNQYTKLVYQLVQYSELDINEHFNSASYLERVLDNFGIDFLNENEATEIEINYLKEGKAGDRLAVENHKTTPANEFISSVIRESDQADLCIVRTAWRIR